MKPTQAIYKASSKTILAEAYKVSLRTFKLWIQPIENILGDYIGKAYTPKQVEKIVELLGEPENIKLISV